jgi:threonine/homoserine/homoserine lactone efflux protein
LDAVEAFGMGDASGSSLLAFAAISLIIELTPGPNMAYLAALSLVKGWRAGVAAVAGVALGLSIYGIAAALGLAAIVERSVVLYEVLRWVGVAYLLWLAWDAWSANADDASADTQLDRSLGEAFRRGLITNLLNPKAAIFYLAVVPDFIVPTGSVAAQTLTLAAIYVAIATSVHSLIVMLASRLATQLNDARRRRLVSRSLALALVAIAVWFAVSTMR